MGEHKVTVIVEGDVWDGWSGYHVDSSMITAADSFELRRPFDAAAWNILGRDQEVTIQIDGTTIMNGFVDRRVRSAKAGTMTLSGRDRVGRLTDEAAPALKYESLKILSAVEALASPWFSRVTLSDARNRRLRRGPGRRVASDSENPVPISIRVPRRGNVHPGMTRWQVIHEIAARAGCVAFSSADGTELFIGKPNYDQAVSYEFIHAAKDATSGFVGNIKDLTITEDDGERYSLIMCGGTGGQKDTNYGENVTDHRGVWFDNEDNRVDGTGEDFIRPKRMYMPERQFESLQDAQRVVENEADRRNYKRHLVSVEAPRHGQRSALFAPNTIARVIDDELDPRLDELYLVVSCAYSGQRDQGETTTLHLVPKGTEIIL